MHSLRFRENGGMHAPMDRITELATFIAVVEQGSLSAAARHLGRPLQSVSRALALLEKSVGVELIRRTTRRCSATEAGAVFYERVKPAFAEIGDAWLEASNRRAEPSGVLRIGAAVLFAPTYVMPAVAAYMRAHPKMQVELALSDAFVDLMAQGLDAAVRIGDLPSSDLKARRLGALRRVTFAAPGYLDEHGRPQHPQELARHNCIVRSGDGNDGRWPYLVDGKLRRVAIRGGFRADSTASNNAAAEHGLGLGFGPLWQVRELVDAGRLELVLVPFEPPKVAIQVVWPATRRLVAKTQLFIDCLAEQLKDERW
jgi:DNA-binding transcriptional LysR family regulator